MSTITGIFKNPFDNEAITLEQLVHFTTEHLARMVANNPGGALNERIGATTIALSTLEHGAAPDETKAIVQKARARAKEGFRKTLPASIELIQAAVVATYGATAPELLECFPDGRHIYATCDDMEVCAHLDQLITALKPHADDVGQANLIAASGLLTTWRALCGVAGKPRGKAPTDAQKRATHALRLELFRNVLTLALLFPGDEDKAAFYCPEKFLA